MSINKNISDNSTKVGKPLIWTLFFWFSGMASLFIWQSILSLIDYWNDKFQDGIAVYFPFVYMSASFFNFIFYDMINQCINFRKQQMYIPVFMIITFYGQFILGETVDKNKQEHLKLSIFYTIVFFQGFLNNQIQTTLSRFCFNFDGGDITNFSSGNSLIGVICSSLTLVLSLCNLSMKNQFIIYLGFTSILLFLTIMNFYYFIKTFVDVKTKNSLKDVNQTECGIIFFIYIRK